MVNWVIGIRGIKHDSDRFINELSAKYLPHEWKNTGLPEICPSCKKINCKEQRHLQVRVCPIQLFDVSFPEQHSEIMAATLFRGGGEPINENHKLLMWAVRKTMGV